MVLAKRHPLQRDMEGRISLPWQFGKNTELLFSFPILPGFEREGAAHQAFSPPWRHALGAVGVSVRAIRLDAAWVLGGVEVYLLLC